MSTNTGVPPALWMAPAVAKKVNGGGDDLVARLEVERPERQQQRVGAAGATDGVLGLGEPGDLRLELRPPPGP